MTNTTLKLNDCNLCTQFTLNYVKLPIDRTHSNLKIIITTYNKLIINLNSLKNDKLVFFYT